MKATTLATLILLAVLVVCAAAMATTVYAILQGAFDSGAVR